MKLITLLLLTLCLLTFIIDVDSRRYRGRRRRYRRRRVCYRGRRYRVSNRQKYIMVNKAATYAQARKYCRKKYGGGGGACGKKSGLATIKNAADQRKLTYLLKRYSCCNRVWIGKNYIRDEIEEFNEDDEENNFLTLNDNELNNNDKDMITKDLQEIDDDDSNDNNEEKEEEEENVDNITEDKYRGKQCNLLEKYCSTPSKSRCNKKTCFVCNNPNYGGGGGSDDTCYISGDPHFITCWKKSMRIRHDFQGCNKCVYLYITPCKKKNGYKKVPFEIAGKHRSWFNRRGQVITTLFLKLYNRKTQKKELVLTINDLTVKSYINTDYDELEEHKPPVNDGKTPNYFDNGNSYYTAVRRGSQRVIKVFINSKKNKNCKPDLIIAGTLNNRRKRIYYSFRVTINRKKYLGKICGLLGYYNKNRKLFFCKRNNLRRPVVSYRRKTRRAVKLWGQSYLDSDSDLQTNKPECMVENYDDSKSDEEINKYLSLIPDVKNDKSIKECKKKNSFIRNSCQKKYDDDCKEKYQKDESNNCDLKNILSEKRFIKDCVFDACSECLDNLPKDEKSADECTKGEGTAICKDYCQERDLVSPPEEEDNDWEDETIDQDAEDNNDQYLDDEDDENEEEEEEQVLGNINNNFHLIDSINTNYLLIVSLIIIIPLIIFYSFYRKCTKSHDAYQPLIQN